MITQERKIVLVTRRTQLEELIIKYHTLDQARFYLENLGADFSDYQIAHQNYIMAKQLLIDVIEKWGRFQIIDRAFLPNFLFGPEDIVLVLGQDGLVANTMKYLNGQPLVGINPDPLRYDGILLPFVADDVQKILYDVAARKRNIKLISMAKASLKDGQVLYAVNDLFIGQKGHVSAKYAIKLDQYNENQSSSGIIISTGLGATGWMKSITTGALAISRSLDNGINQLLNTQPYSTHIEHDSTLRWSSEHLQFAVREPFPSQQSQTNLVAGFIKPNQSLDVLSYMPENGVIFSDGIESDFLEFNAGMLVQVMLAERKGLLVV